MYTHTHTHTHTRPHTHTPQGPKSQTLNLRLKAHAFFCTVGLKGFTRIPVSLVRRLNSLSPRRAAAVLGCDHAHFRGKCKPLSVVCPGFGYIMYMKTACLCCHGQAYRGGAGALEPPTWPCTIKCRGPSHEQKNLYAMNKFFGRRASRQGTPLMTEPPALTM